jgi:signal transduction histidine kinase
MVYAPTAPIPGGGVAVPVPIDEIVERLTQHRTLGDVPVQELRWLAEHGVLVRFEAGTTPIRKDQPIHFAHIVLSGHFCFYVDRPGARVKVADWRGGDVSGVLPYSRLKTSPGDGVIEEATDMLLVQRDLMPEVIRSCPNATARFVHVMLDRARMFNSNDLQLEKLATLGKLSAGLAHELNNPASAATRSARLLREALGEADDAALALGAAELKDGARSALEELRSICLSEPIAAIESPLERADREDAIVEWLEDHRASAEHAEALARTPATVASLERVARILGESGQGEALEPALRWLAAGCSAHALAADLERASSRIHELVSRVKRFTYMDRVNTLEPMDIASGITDTIAIMASKVRAKSATAIADIPQDLPRVMGIGGELNQVWLNLLDNAIDALPEGGRVVISATSEGDHVAVRMTDNGHGIPPDIQSRIFDPFFSTKAVGQGTGLGLDTAKRILDRHSARVEVESGPGRTEFTVRLPVA